MTVSPWLAAAVILIGNAVLSLGNTLQKLNIGWMDKNAAVEGAAAAGAVGGPRGRARSPSFLGWLVGFVLMNIVPVFQFVALLGLSANVVGAAAGSSVAFTAIFSRILLGEKLGARKAVLTLVLFAAIAAASLLGGGSAADAGFSPIALAAFIAIPLAAAPFLLAARSRRGGKVLAKRFAPLFAAVSGCFGGYMVVAMRALQLDAGAAISAGWLASPYLYAFLLCGFGGFSIVQLAYKDGEMSSVAPALYGMQVLWPALASYFVFGSPFFALQAAAFALVAACVVAIAGGAPRSARP
jgi:drug/metabolite transporter (DMT)-like permease